MKPKKESDIAAECHKEVSGLLNCIGDRMTYITNRIDVQSSFLGAFVYFQMGQTKKAQALADTGSADLLCGWKSNEEKEGGLNAPKIDDDDKQGQDKKENDDDVEDNNDESTSSFVELVRKRKKDDNKESKDPNVKNKKKNGLAVCCKVWLL